MLIQKSFSLVLNSVNDNVFAGDQFEFAPFRALVSIGITISATGIEADVLCGQRSIVTRAIPLIKATSPVIPDDFVIKFAARAGERVILRLRNTTGGTLTGFATAIYTPV